MRGKSQPSLEDERNDAGPVEQSAHLRHLHNHVVEADVIDNEREGVEKR